MPLAIYLYVCLTKRSHHVYLQFVYFTDPENTINCNHCGSRPEPVTVIEGHSIKLDCLVSGRFVEKVLNYHLFMLIGVLVLVYCHNVSLCLLYQYGIS